MLGAQGKNWRSHHCSDRDPRINQEVDSLSLQHGAFLTFAQDVPAPLPLPWCLLRTVFVLITAATLRGFD